MIIDDKKYVLPERNYIKEETIKKQIVIGHTSSNQMKHFQGWNLRLNGNYDKTAAFTISTDGSVHQHFDPIYTSNILTTRELNNRSIIILIENEGWLVKDIQKNKFINWVGDIYNKPDLVVEKRWRGYVYWAPYSDKQLKSAINLSKKLCEEFYINKFAIPHNTKIDNLDGFEGVIYKSNIEKHHTDLSPAWNFEKFKFELEK